MALPYDIIRNPTFLGMEQSKGIMRDVATGRRIMGLICSDPGFAKTYNAKHIMRVENVPFHECSPTTEAALVKVLWGIESGLITSKGRKPAVMLADDKDALFRRETTNPMKSAFGSDRRSVNFDTPEAMKNEDRKNSENEREKAKYKATVPDTTFIVSVRFLGLANLNYTDPAVVAGLSTHFLALVSKGLDPSWIPNDAEHGGRDVFLASHYLATEGKMLVSEGYPYWIARDAVEFYVRNVNRLIDIPPRRLSQIAYVIRHNPDLAERERRLNDMLRPTDQRPKLILPESWVSVLLWPSDPPRRPDPQPDPDPPPAASAPAPVEPEPDPPPAASAPIPVEPEPDPNPPSSGSAPGPLEPDPDPRPAASAPTPPDSPAGPSPEIVERNRVAVLDAILDTILPPGDRRQSAFFGAVEQVNAMGGTINEQVLRYIRRGMSDEQHSVAAIFARDTPRQILDRASIAMADRYQTDQPPPPPPDPKAPIGRINLGMALSDAEMRDLTLQWGLKPFRGRAGPLDIIAYQRRCGFLKIAGPELTPDQLGLVRKKAKGFWQEWGAAEHWLTEILNPSTQDDVSPESNNKPVA